VQRSNGNIAHVRVTTWRHFVNINYNERQWSTTQTSFDFTLTKFLCSARSNLCRTKLTPIKAAHDILSVSIALLMILCDTWYMTHYTWYMIYDKWYVFIWYDMLWWYDIICYDNMIYMIRYIIWYIYLFTAIGLPPGGSSTVYIYIQTVHRTTQSTQPIHRTTHLTKREECGPCLVFASYTVAFDLQLRKQHGETSVRVAKECYLARWKQNIHNRAYITIRIHKYNNKNT
jgi:hypothetical protein